MLPTSIVNSAGYQAGRRAGRKAGIKRKYVRRVPAKKAVTKLVKRVLASTMETKEVAWFNGAQGGLYFQAGNVDHNQFINNNASDILRIIPPVVMGVSDTQRIGDTITPQSLQVHCKVIINPTANQGQGFVNGQSYNITAVAYCLQHVSYKTYASLAANNAFSQLLKINDLSGGTTAFNGSYSDANLPVDKGYYKLLAKKRIHLRCSGNTTTGQGGTAPTLQGTNNNAAPFQHEWVWNMGKHLPKKLVYAEPNSVAPGLDDPLNAAPFWCVGFYQTDGTDLGTNPQLYLTVQYTATMRYKDA